MLYKKCRLCGEMKEVTEFHKKKGTKDGVRNECKECVKTYLKKWKDTPEYKQREKEYDKARYDEKREEILERKKEYHIENREEILKKKKEYRDRPENKERLKEYSAIYRRENRDKFYKYRRENPHIIAWRTVLYSALKRLGTHKQGHTIDMLGYSAMDLKNHIEKLFTEGMSWKNYGEWEIDHIKPVISFYPTDDVKDVCSLNNLRPLWQTTREINGIIYEGNLNRSKY